MTLTLVRVDDRIIHGQTTTRWSKEKHVDGFLVVGDEVVNDELRRRVIKSAAGNLKLGIYGEDQAAEKVKMGKDSDFNFFLIASSPQIFARLKKNDVDFGDQLNVGPMNTREGSIVVGRTLAIDDKDFEAFEYLDKSGIKIFFQLIPSEEKKYWPEVRKKYLELKNN